MVHMPSTRVVVASDQAIYRRGLASLLISLENTQLIGEAQSATEAIQLCEMAQPDIVLVDLRQMLEFGHELAKRIYSHCPKVKVILMLRPEMEDRVQEELETLPVYYFSRDVSEEEFKAALLQICQTPLQPEEMADTAPSVFHHQGEKLDEEMLAFEQRANQTRYEGLLTRELNMAGKIQLDILPEESPNIPGWEIAAGLEAAHEISGDFYDFIPLTEKKLGVVVADVTDKGMGAALFMALSSSLMRTYAVRFPTLPAICLSAVSNRLLADTRGGMFVTALYGVLEPHTGRFVFANAGHPPGFLISNWRRKEAVEPLRPTGMALGVSEQARWKQRIVRVSPGDLLVLYTDGITEAQNSSGEFYGGDRLLDVVLSMNGTSASEVYRALLEDVHRFMGCCKRQDDIALVVIRRQE